jgi:hypothetical protein
LIARYYYELTAKKVCAGCGSNKRMSGREERERERERRKSMEETGPLFKLNSQDFSSYIHRHRRSVCLNGR